MKDKYFLITIDTEGDNLWAVRGYPKPLSRLTVRNGAYLERFQILTERYGLVPTYLVDQEMAFCQPLLDMACQHKVSLEIGMHMHAFSTPPYYALTDHGGGNKAYAGEYPEEVQQEKIRGITMLLKERFHCDILSHRGGRWYIDAGLAKILREEGYYVDCTVTPGVDWTFNRGQVYGSRGVDYRRAPKHAYSLSPKDVCKPGNVGHSTLYEVPMSTRLTKLSFKERLSNFAPWQRQCSKVEWLRPNGHNLSTMLNLVDRIGAEDVDFLEFMLHSSELMPGGSPTFQTESSIEQLYEDLKQLFQYVCEKGYRGIGLAAYAQQKGFCR